MFDLAMNFIAGALLINCIPHLAAGLRGEPFPSPFSRPPGVGNSHPVLNVLWGLANVVGGFLLLDYSPVRPGVNPTFIAAVLGALIAGCAVAGHFYRTRSAVTK